MKALGTILLFLLSVGLFGQRVTPEQIKKVTGNGKQKILLSDGTTGVFDYESDGVILPYDTQAAAEGQYDVNALVTYGGYIYRSTANNNVTTPGVGTWEIMPGSTTAGETRLVQDSILVYYRVGVEVGRDTMHVMAGAESVEEIGPTNVILRVPEVGDTITADSPGEWLAWWSFAPPTITLTLSPTTTVYEVGTSNSITLAGATTNPGSATLSGGVLTRTIPASATVTSFGTSTSYSQGITFAPTQGGSATYTQLTYSFQATQDWSGAGESGTASSTTRTMQGVYPVFYGMASTDTTTVKGAIYSTLTKSVVTEGSKTYSFTGSGLIYYAFPATWSDTNLSSITDPNGFDVTASFTRTTASVSSSGLTNDYSSVSYIVYYLNTGTTTTSSSSYTFNQ